jgi:hypothetical protein
MLRLLKSLHTHQLINNKSEEADLIQFPDLGEILFDADVNRGEAK